MSGHYFKNNPALKHAYQSYTIELNGHQYRFLTDAGVFSKTYLDFGTRSLLNVLEIDDQAQRFLDLGCGYGPIGIYVKKNYPNLDVHLSDVNDRAVLLAQKNATENQVVLTTIVSDGFNNHENTFDVITLNPPIRAGKEVIFRLYDESFEHLTIGGKLWIVIQKKQGAESTVKYLTNLFGNCMVVDKNKGYYILVSKKS
ncbi:MAG TPA: 16S rRNA methyltransferase [Acholeplasmataceae bacterium]|nr:16S rRNA methyltransferase [Acholeplasmataceae bacterium]